MNLNSCEKLLLFDDLWKQIQDVRLNNVQYM